MPTVHKLQLYTAFVIACISGTAFAQSTAAFYVALIAPRLPISAAGMTLQDVAVAGENGLRFQARYDAPELRAAALNTPETARAKLIFFGYLHPARDTSYRKCRCCFHVAMAPVEAY